MSIDPNRAFFCSELIAKAYKSLEFVENKGLASGKYYPYHFSKKGEGQLKFLNNYKLDGLIFTPNKPVFPFFGKRWDENLKWKPADENTIDFLIDIVDNYDY